MSNYSVSVTDAKINFNKLLNQITKSGDSVTIFKHSKPIAVISPATNASITNLETLQAMQEAEEIVKDKNHKHFDTPEDLFLALGI